jgi:hypothetical protein
MADFGRLPTATAALPFGHYIAHIPRESVTYPGHQFAVKFEIRPTLTGEKAPNVLRVLVVGIDFSCGRYHPTMPIKFHLHTPLVSKREWQLLAGCSR